MTEKNSLADILKRLREEKRKKRIEKDQWTQSAVAKRIGVTRQAYIAWEKGYSLPDIDHLKRIIEVFRPDEKTEANLYRAVAQIPPEIDNLPVPINRFFTGREAHLNQLDSLFERGEQVVVLSGPTGIGKTEIALAYAYHYYRKKYRAVFWVDATAKTTFRKCCDDIVQKLGLHVQREQKGQYRVQAVKQWLQSHTNWLMILDNYDDQDYLRPFFPDKPLGHVVITTRTEHVSTGIGIGNISVDVMESEEGMLFMLRLLGMLHDSASLDSISPEVREPVRQLVERLERCPLLLKQAGIFMGRADMSLADYMQFLSNQPHTLTMLPDGIVHVDIGLMEEAGLGSLAIGDKMSFLMYMYRALQVRVKQRMVVLIPKQQMEEYMQLRDTNSDKDIGYYLRINVPNFEEVTADEYAKLKAELIQTAPQILANYQQQADDSLTDKSPE